MQQSPALAEFERDIIRERTSAGLAAARARGRKGGRPRGMDEKKRRMALALRADPSRSVQEICETLHISRATFYRYTSQTSGAGGIHGKQPGETPRRNTQGANQENGG